MLWNRGRHNFQFGGDLRRQQFNYLSQQDARGAFTFTGAASGSDFADFLLGIPDTSSIAFGNADKYFRESVYDAYFTDDWRISPEFTLNAGVRWEYGAPITELYNRLVNLDIAPDFTAVAPVVANAPIGSLTGQHYPSSLIQPDKSAFEPRVGLAWRPLSGSSLVLRAGYGVYYDTSVYQTIATQMAQQAPLSKSLSVQNSPADPLTLANGFNASPTITPDTFAIDPNFRIGYAQNWQLAIQRDLPGSFQMTATYLGIKGTRGVQEFLPNTFPSGAVNPCPACPTGFAYLVSNGNSTRESAQLQLRRRLHNGLTGILQYTFSKSIDDDAALGGEGASATPQNNAAQGGATPAASGTTVLAPPAATGSQNLMIAQNWLNLSAERSLSAFDQRHLLSLQLQYTTGMGVAGGTLLTRLEGSAAQRVDVRYQNHCRQRSAAKSRLSRSRPGYRRHRNHSPRLHRPAALCVPRRSLPQSRRVHRAAARPMGKRGTKFHHRPRSVCAERFPRPHVPAQRPLQSRLARRFHKRAQSRHVHRLEHHHKQPAIRPACCRQ